MAHILMVDDEPKMRHILKIMLELKGHTVIEASNGREALEHINGEPFDLIISDIKMPEMDGFGLLDELKSMNDPPPMVFITAFATIDSAVEAMKKGAIDYITKPFKEDRIHLTIEKALGISRLLQENRELKDRLSQVQPPQDVVCASTAMQEILRLAERVAQKSDTTVLILGESGVGKEVLARFIHHRSPRDKGRFFAVNCAAISQGLIESTLFGHERGAFTGADRRKKGFFEYAHNGTLFLDEIGDLPFEAQAKLLRALQEKTIQRVGGNEAIKVNVRVLCATNQDLEELVKKGRFRQDLYYRINVFPIVIPPLRERKEDIIPLAIHFMEKALGRKVQGSPLTSGARRILLEHSWPGNVREIANAMERAIIMAGEPPITVEHLAFLKPQKSSASLKEFRLPPEGIDLEELEKDIIRQALELTDNNQSRAARLLGLTRSKLRTRVKQLENG